MTNPADIEFAWACGLFEGEGSIVCHKRERKNGGGTTRQLSLAMTDEETVLRFHAAVECGRLNGPYRCGGRGKPLYGWFCTRWGEIDPLLQRMLPFLGSRRSGKARELLACPPTRLWGQSTSHVLLDDRQRSEICVLYAQGWGRDDIADTYGTNKARVWRIATKGAF